MLRQVGGELVGPSGRQPHIHFPLLALPALSAVLVLSSTLTGASGAALLSLLRAQARSRTERARELARLSGAVALDISGRILSPKSGGRGARPSSLAGLASSLLRGAAFVLAVRLLRRAARAMVESLALMNACDDRLDEDLREKLDGVGSRPWGEGLPKGPVPGEWRRYLHTGRSAAENLEELHGCLGLRGRSARELSLEQLTEAVRRLWGFKYVQLPRVTSKYWSMEQARSIALALAEECHLKCAAPSSPEAAAATAGADVDDIGGGGAAAPLAECVEIGIHSHLPWPTPRWVQLSQRLGIAALRPILTGALAWTSRWIDTPLGRMHIYDVAAATAQAEERPPIIMQHGMFCTSWSMAPLAWLLSRRGYRVLLPDLFDFDHGLSASDGAARGAKVRKPRDSVDALLCLARELVREGAPGVDLMGHSYGAFLMTLLSERCRRDGIPVRRLVLLGPGGPWDALYHTPSVTRFLQQPMATALELAPKWAPEWLVRAILRVSLGVMLSPNNCNLLFGLTYQEYLGSRDIASRTPTLLLWGDEDAVAVPRQPRFLAPFLRSRFPRIDAFWVERGGHCIQAFAALSVAEAADAWLRAPDDAVGTGRALAAIGGPGGVAVSGRGGGVKEAPLWPTNNALYEMELPGPGSFSDADGRRARL